MSGSGFKNYNYPQELGLFQFHMGDLMGQMVRQQPVRDSPEANSVQGLTITPMHWVHTLLPVSPLMERLFTLQALFPDPHLLHPAGPCPPVSQCWFTKAAAIKDGLTSSTCPSAEETKKGSWNYGWFKNMPCILPWYFTRKKNNSVTSCLIKSSLFKKGFIQLF